MKDAQFAVLKAERDKLRKLFRWEMEMGRLHGQGCVCANHQAIQELLR
jgi:hypothetical protein